jgi:hypothetical protein
MNSATGFVQEFGISTHTRVFINHDLKKIIFRVLDPNLVGSESLPGSGSVSISTNIKLNFFFPENLSIMSKISKIMPHRTWPRKIKRVEYQSN